MGSRLGPTGAKLGKHPASQAERAKELALETARREKEELEEKARREKHPRGRGANQQSPAKERH